MQKGIVRIEQKMKTHLLAGCPGLFIQSGEESRVDQLLAELAKVLKLHVIEWNLGYGWVNFDNKSPIKPDIKAGETDLAYCLPSLQDDDLENKIIVIKNAKLALENNSLAIARLKQLLNRIQRHHSSKAAVVLVSESLQIPAEIEAQISLLPLPLPTQSEIEAQLGYFASNGKLSIPDEFLARACSNLSGLSQTEINQVLLMLTQSHTSLNEDALTFILREKEQIITKSGVLEMVQVNNSIADIGGLENLKTWLQRRATIIHRLTEAEEFGIAAPKGVLIAGMPGCGKSLTAKVAASLFGLPLLRLDIGSLLGKYVGESEHNMRRALQMAETVSPCILWVDELEKAFVGMGGNNASEVTSRLLGYFLTWMQEKTGAVFVIATANDITALPPELLRKGRFDETFYVGFPSTEERQKILSIHLRKAKQNTSTFDLTMLAKKCHDYSGADIQNAINEALERAFIDGKPLTQDMIEQAIKDTVSLRETMREQVGKYEGKFEELKLKSASSHQGLSIAQMIKLADDPNQIKRKEVAAHPDCPDDLLKKLAEDKEFSVKEAVYRNERCPESILSKRINCFDDPEDTESELRKLACLHINAPIDLLGMLIKEKKFDDSWLNELLATTHYPDELLYQAGIHYLHRSGSFPTLLEATSPIRNKEDKRKTLASNKYISEHIIKGLIEKDEKSLNVVLAKNSGLTEEYQLILAKNSNADVRCKLASNRGLAEIAQLTLAEDRNDEVRMILICQDGLSESVQLKLTNDNNEMVRKALAAKDELTESVQLKLSEDSSDEVRKILASRSLSSTAESVRLKLEKDPSEEVRKLIPSFKTEINKICSIFQTISDMKS